MVELAQAHALGALLHSRLEGAHDSLPSAAQTALRQAHTDTAAYTIFFEFSLQALIESFRREGIPLVAYKGIPLARALYGDPGLRPGGDIDVMVRTADLERSHALLQREGWELQRTWEIHDIFIKELGGTRIPLELHWISQREGEYYIPETRFWEEAAEREDEGWQFSNEMTLLIIILHAARHFFVPYRQMVDIAHAVALWNETLNWERLVALAVEANAMPIVATVLALVQRDLAAPAPRHETLTRLMASRRIRLTTRYLSPARLLRTTPFSALDRYLVPILCGAWEPARLILHDLLPPRELIAYRYGIAPDSHLVPLYTLLRPLWLLSKHLRREKEQ